MAAAIIPRRPTADEYLNSSYRPDMEYVHGVLVERSMPTIAHSLLQMLLIQYFGRFQKTFGFLPLPEVRTQIVERARYRIPDLVLCPLPLPAGILLTSVPWVVIEILSPDDRFPDQLEVFPGLRTDRSLAPRPTRSRKTDRIPLPSGFPHTPGLHHSGSPHRPPPLRHQRPLHRASTSLAPLCGLLGTWRPLRETHEPLAKFRTASLRRADVSSTEYFAVRRTALAPSTS